MTLKSSIKETTEDVLHKNTLDALIDTTSKGINTEVNERNKKFIDEESAKITRWAEDQTYALEQELRDIKKRIKEKERIFKSESDGTLRLSIQKEIQTLQRQMKKKRQELFNLEDEIEEERERLIEKIEVSLEQTITKETLFIINWTIK
jgi:adenine-specific DNA-methyltransferase